MPARQNKVAEMLTGFEIVDLTLTMDEAYPMVGGNLPGFRHVVYNWYETLPDNPQPLQSRSYVQETTEGTYYSCWMQMHEHSGTHFDATSHCIPPAGSGLPYASDASAWGDETPLGALQGPAVVVDTRGLRSGDNEPGVSPLVTPDYLREWEDQYGDFGPGDVVIFLTGWDEYWVPSASVWGKEHPYRAPTSYRGGDMPGWPAPNSEAVVYLLEKGVELLATDAPTLGAAQDINSVHYELLGRGKVMVESLTQLDRLPTRGSYFVFLPLKVARSSGCPGRAFAYVPRVAA